MLSQHEREASNQILATIKADPALAVEMYRQMDDIPALAEQKGMSTLGAFILYVRWMRQIVGPKPHLTSELFDALLEHLPTEQQDHFAKVLRAELRSDRKAHDIVKSVIVRRASRGAALPNWLQEIAADIESGELPRPKPKRGRPAGAGSLRHPFAQQNIASLVYILDGRIRAQGDGLTLYNDTNVEAITVCSIVAQALTDDGLPRTAAQVRDAWLAHKDSFEPFNPELS